MKIAVRYELALERHPDVVAKVMGKLRGGKSSHKYATPESLHWDYECHIRSSARNEPEPPPQRTIEEQVSDHVSRTYVCLAANVGRWWGRASIEGVPEEAVRLYRMQFEESRWSSKG